MEHYKFYCQDHPYEQVINFCADPRCLTALCATCICEHTRIHLQGGTSPKYENIKATYTRYNETMRQQIHTIEEDSQWLKNVCCKIEQKRQNIRSTLGRARQDCLNLVNRHFDELEEKISNEVANDSRKNSLHSAYRLQNLSAMIHKEINSLLLHSKDLSSPKFIQAVKFVQEDILRNSRDFHLRVCKQLRQNEVYTAQVIYRQDLLGDLSMSLKKLVNLQILMPRVENVENPLKIQRVEEVKRSNSVRKMNSSMIISPKTTDFPDFSTSKFKNMSLLMPKHASSMIVSSNSTPLQQLQQAHQMAARQSQTPSSLWTKGSRLSAALNVIKQSRGQLTQNDIKSITSSQVSWEDKQNESLAYSTFLETGINFLK